jgi:hypothetical protein
VLLFLDSFDPFLVDAKVEHSVFLRELEHKKIQRYCKTPLYRLNSETKRVLVILLQHINWSDLEWIQLFGSTTV